MQEFLQSRIIENLSLQPVYQPQFFRLINPEDKHRFQHLLETNPCIQVFDEIQSQLIELVKSLNPSTVFTSETVGEAVRLHTGQVPAHEYGVWVYYPWAARMVHILDEKEFVFLRTSRNQYKIAPDEQDILATKKIGVVGLSVGQSVAVTMAMERLFGEIRLADFDLLELTNLNRIRTGIHNLSLPKVVSVAREILEIDPFLNVICYTDGLTEGNMDDFFLKGGKLDLLVEECDGIDIKILCRYKARELGVPVVMESSDRGLLDVERFDLEPDRKILHGLIEQLDVQKVKTLKTSEEKLPYMLPIVGFETLSTRLKASALEVGQSITTWPQLASAVTFGGGLTADVSRRILLSEYHESGRYYVDIEELVGNKNIQPAQVEPWRPPIAALWEKDMVQIADSLSFSYSGFALSDDIILELVSAANMAPSSGNNQPWKWLYRHNRLFLFLDRSRSYSLWDVNDAFGYVGLGAALENLTLSARQKGYDVHISDLAEQLPPGLVAIVTLTNSQAPSNELDSRLAEHIPLRITNRNNSARVVLPEGVLAGLSEAIAGMANTQLYLFDQPTMLAEAARIVTACERLRFLHPEGHREFFQHEVRWDRAEAEKTRDGLDLTTLDLSASDVTGLRLAKQPEVIDLLRKWKKGKGLERLSKKLIINSSAVGVISVASDTKSGYIQAGQASQRIWLMAGTLGLAVQPIMAPLYLFNYYRSGPDLPDFMKKELEALIPDSKQLFRLSNFEQPAFLFRFAIADAPKARALRKPVEDTIYISKRHQYL